MLMIVETFSCDDRVRCDVTEDCFVVGFPLGLLLFMSQSQPVKIDECNDDKDTREYRNEYPGNWGHLGLGGWDFGRHFR